MTLREKQMAARRKRILDTAERIIRDAGATDFSMRALAAAAETAPATPYNLFESKEGLLYARYCQVNFSRQVRIRCDTDSGDNCLFPRYKRAAP